MTYRRLYVFVEGTDDVRFFERIMKPGLEEAYDHINIVEYAQETRKKQRSFLLSVGRIEGADAIWVCDNDNARCVTERKQEVIERIPAVNDIPIVVVVKMIEGWYLAGVDAEGSRVLGIENQARTDALTKADFSSFRPKKVKTNRDFMLAILELFQIETARQKNRSFDYFCRTFLQSDTLSSDFNAMSSN